MTIVDRVKELIKVSGFQVAPAEIEALLVGHPGVADVAVIGVPDDQCGEVPKAFVVAGGRRDAAISPSCSASSAAHVAPLQAGAGARAGRGDPEVALGQDPAPPAPGAAPPPPEGRVLCARPTISPASAASGSSRLIRSTQCSVPAASRPARSAAARSPGSRAARRAAVRRCWYRPRSRSSAEAPCPGQSLPQP